MWNERLFEQEFSHAHSRIYGVRFEGALVGFLICHAVVDEAHILNIVLKKNVRGRGLGKEFLFSVIDELHKLGIKRITLEVRVSNEVARCLYDALGFVPVGLRKNYYSDNGEDATVMSLNVRQCVMRFHQVDVPSHIGSPLGFLDRQSSVSTGGEE